MIKLDIINHVIGQIGCSKATADRAVEMVFESVKGALSRGERVKFLGFGIFEIRPRKTGVGPNPRSGMVLSIPPGQSIRFRPGKGLQDLE